MRGRRSVALLFTTVLLVVAHTQAAMTAGGPVMPPPLERVGGSVPWGANLHPEDTGYDLGKARTQLGYIKRLGCRFVRTDFIWSDLEPARGCWDEGRFAFYGGYLDAARAKGLDVQVLLTRAPEWAAALYGADPDSFFGEYEEYCSEVAKRFGERVHYYQIWNEADNFIDFVYFWDDWRLFASGRSGLDAFDPDLESYANLTSLPWSEGALDDWMIRAGGAIDIIGVDYYPGTWALVPYEDWSPFARVLEKITDPRDPAYGKKAAVQETGFSTWLRFWHSENDQGNWINASLPALQSIVATHNSLHENRVISCCWYELIDADTAGGWWLENHFGILRSDMSKKPGYRHLRARISEF